MRVQIQEIDIIKIDRQEAEQLIAELNRLDLPFTKDYPLLYELKQLLSNNFQASFPDIHRIVKPGER
jgi:hypothetical protein